MRACGSSRVLYETTAEKQARNHNDIQSELDNLVACREGFGEQGRERNFISGGRGRYLAALLSWCWALAGRRIDRTVGDIINTVWISIIFATVVIYISCMSCVYQLFTPSARKIKQPKRALPKCFALIPSQHARPAAKCDSG